MRGLDRVAPGVGEQVLSMIEQFGLEGVSEAAAETETQSDAYAFEQMVGLTGSAIRDHNEGDFSGFTVAKATIKQIVNNHRVNIF